METSLTYPLVRLQSLYHAGTFNASQKGINSMEGAGLSVSHHPEDWIRIAKLGGSSIYCMKKKNNSFLNFYDLQEKHKQEIRSWGMAEGYVQEGVIYELSWETCDDNDCEVTCQIESEDKNYLKGEQEALEEEEIESVLVSKTGLLPLLKLKDETRNPNAHVSQSFSLLTTLFAEHALSIDGVWWEEELDPYAYSAPRGVIVPSKISSWTHSVALNRGVHIYQC